MNLQDALRKQLDSSRPSRYRMEDRQWVDDVADAIDLNDIEFDVEDFAREYVRTQARSLESTATRSGNRIMREFHNEQMLPIDWASHINAPIAIINSELVDGEIRTFQERVRLADATAQDFELWAQKEQRDRQRDFDARGEAVTGALEIAGRMRSEGAMTFRTWAEAQSNALVA